MKYNDIVVGVDGSPVSLAALRWALDEAAIRDCLVRAVLVWQAQAAVTGPQPVLGVPYRLPEQTRADCAAALEASVRYVSSPKDDARLRTELIEGPVPSTLVAAAQGADLLVLGSHGHGRLYSAVIGSVADYCIRHASCPTVIISARIADAEWEWDWEWPQVRKAVAT